MDRLIWEDNDMATNGSDLHTTDILKDAVLKDNGLAAKSHAGTDAAARMAHDFVDRVARLAEESEEHIRNATLTAEQGLKDSLETARTKSLAAKETVGDLVQRHPWAAVGIAFGVGVLIATLAQRGDRVD